MALYPPNGRGMISVNSSVLKPPTEVARIYDPSELVVRINEFIPFELVCKEPTVKIEPD